MIRNCEIDQNSNQPKKSRIDLKSIIEKSSENIRQNGFINYFGLQRFGSSSIPTHQIGIEILKGNFEEAVHLLLCPREEAKHKSFLTEMRETWENTRDPVKSLEKLPKKHSTEGKLLFGLKDNRNDFVGALGRLPRTLRQMYVHSVQSLIWNRLVSERLKNGHEIIIGDLVQPDESNKLNVFHITEENIKNYNFDDVVMTMPGFDVSYPKIIEEKVEKTLQEIGLTKDSFSGSVKDYRLPGAYRKILARPKNFNVEIVKYSNENENILKSERDWLVELGGKEIEEKEMEENGKEKKGNEEIKNGLIVEFELPTASYATMALRELLHNDEK